MKLKVILIFAARKAMRFGIFARRGADWWRGTELLRDRWARLTVAQ
jgi:hypothetical protein